MFKRTVILASLFLAQSAIAATEYTGESVDGVKAIQRLDLNDLAPGKIHRFYLQGAENALGQHWLIPVVIAKGSQPGVRIGLQTGVHGDELNGSLAVHRLFERLDPKQLKGSVIAVVSANSTGLLASSRYYQMEHDRNGIDFNRVWPGKIDGNTAEQQVYRIFNGIWKGNADSIIDIHTQSTGTAYPLYMYADYRVPGVKVMAELFPADIIKIDPGEPGAAEQAFNDAGMPSVTLEIGSPKTYQSDLVNRSVQGFENLMMHFGMIPGVPAMTAKQQGTFIGTESISIRAQRGGYAEILVALNQDIRAGQLLAVQRNGFGDIIARYTAPFDARVSSIGTDPLREPGGMLVRLIRLNTQASCKDGC